MSNKLFKPWNQKMNPSWVKILVKCIAQNIYRFSLSSVPYDAGCLWWHSLGAWLYIQVSVNKKKMNYYFCYMYYKKQIV